MRDKQVINLSRRQAQGWGKPVGPSEYVWISIGEPEDGFSHISNPILDALPNLKLSFWDLEHPVNFRGRELPPPSEVDARAIVDFLWEHKEKSVLCNCAAGVSRSGAVALFCYLNGYQWIHPNRANASPNSRLVDLLCKTWAKKGLEHLAGILYEEYCLSVGGKAFNGDPLPKWADFLADPSKKTQSDAWVAVAKKAESLSLQM